MCLTMIDPSTSWFEIIELPVVLKPKKKNGKMNVTAEYFDKTLAQVARSIICGYVDIPVVKM